MSANTVAIAGNVSSDVTIAYSPNGHAVANFTVAVNDRRFDQATGTWTDAEPAFIRCSVWRRPAENAAETLRTGSRIVVVGKMRTNTVESADGSKRTYTELEADEVAVSLKFATATVTKNTRAAAAEPTTAA